MLIKRPFGVTLLLWMVLMLSVWGAVRFIAALRWWDALNEFHASLGPVYLSITGAGWGVAGGVLLYHTWKAKAWARPVVVIFLLLWLIEYWSERIFFQAPRANIPFALTSSVSIFIFIVILTILPGTKSFFTRSEEHEQPEQKPDTE